MICPPDMSLTKNISLSLEGLLTIAEPQALGSEFVQYRRLDLPAETSKVGETQVIGDYDEEVGSFLRGHPVWTMRKRDAVGLMSDIPSFLGRRLNRWTVSGREGGARFA